MVFGTDIKEKKKQSKTFFWHISELIQSTTQQETLLFDHTWSGCDATSAIYQKGNQVQYGALRS